MSSILTNTSAMVALQTMKSINSDLSTVQSQISTGQKVSSARDNAAVWAISKVMDSDVIGFKGISDSLSLGSSTVAVAQQASQTVTDLLTQIKSKIVSAQDPNVDTNKIQTDIDALRSQVGSVVSAAQLNGLNLVDGSHASVDILASLDRSASGVTTSSITVNGQDLSTGGYTANDVFNAGAGTATVSTNADVFSLSLSNTGGSDSITIQNGATAWAAGDKVTLNLGNGTQASYTVSASDVSSGANSIPDLVAVGLKNSVDSLGISGMTVDYNSASPGQLTFTNNGTNDIAVTGQFSNAGSGGLGALAGVDVTTTPGATAALGNIETMIQTSIDAAAQFGSVGSRITTQQDFVGKLTDAMKTGIGSLVDTDMEAASARLQALQVQQQLATQSLSIANKQPQSLLSLFR